jgi:ABC-2 type transport system ATP-binding protein
VLEVHNVRKRYGAIQAVDDISFQVQPGETIGLLGPNGAGKTTTVSIISGLLKPDEGRVLLDGVAIQGDRDPVKRKLGLVPQDLALYDEMSAQANLELFAALYDITDPTPMHNALDLVGLRDRAKDRVGTYSGGMKRRLNLAAALLHDPQILLLDEPTVGVDPQSRNAIFDNLEQLKAQGKTLIYTTHYMEEAERLCDRIVIVDQGRVLANDTLTGLLHRLPATNRLLIHLTGPADPSPELALLPGVHKAQRANHVLSLWLTDLATDAPQVLQWLTSHNHLYEHVASEKPTLETVFLNLTGRSLRDA